MPEPVGTGSFTPHHGHRRRGVAEYQEVAPLQSFNLHGESD